jgi:hypothetical protein
MSETKFTKGPHRVIGDELQYVNGDLYAVIQTPHAAIDIIAPKVMKDEHMANARLYAAAPDLYKALKATCCRYSRSKECDGPEKCDRCAALALAESQQ